MNTLQIILKHFLKSKHTTKDLGTFYELSTNEIGTLNEHATTDLGTLNFKSQAPFCF